MLALLGVWLGLITFVVAAGMLVYRPWMTDLTVTGVLYFGAPGAMCFGGLVLWGTRRSWLDDGGLVPRQPDPGIVAQRLQSKVAIMLALLAVAIVYYLIINSTKLEPIVRAP